VFVLGGLVETFVTVPLMDWATSIWF
jgi:hypothetical protein